MTLIQRGNFGIAINCLAIQPVSVVTPSGMAPEWSGAYQNDPANPASIPSQKPTFEYQSENLQMFVCLVQARARRRYWTLNIQLDLQEPSRSLSRIWPFSSPRLRPISSYEHEYGRNAMKRMLPRSSHLRR